MQTTEGNDLILRRLLATGTPSPQAAQLYLDGKFSGIVKLPGDRDSQLELKRRAFVAPLRRRVEPTHLFKQSCTVLAISSVLRFLKSSERSKKGSSVSDWWWHRPHVILLRSSPEKVEWTMQGQGTPPGAGSWWIGEEACNRFRAGGARARQGLPEYPTYDQAGQSDCGHVPEMRNSCASC